MVLASPLQGSEVTFPTVPGVGWKGSLRAGSDPVRLSVEAEHLRRGRRTAADLGGAGGGSRVPRAAGQLVVSGGEHSHGGRGSLH